MTNQVDQVYTYMREVGEITPLDAMREFGIMRLGARIWDLKRMGVNVLSRTITHTNRWGKAVHFSAYRLSAPVQQELPL
jgi:hypothetical protein